MALTKVSTGMLSADLASVDLNIDANTLYIDVSNNRVGINNTGPATALDVTGTVTADGLTISAPSGDTPASIGTTTAGSFLSISDGNTTSGRSPLVGVITDDMVFYTSAGSYNERMRIDANGLVQIGTTSNTGGARVDVVSNATSAYTARSASSGASTTVKAVRSVDSGAANFANAQYDALSHAWVLSSTTLAMTLASSGNVGIGTAIPRRKLEVSGVAGANVLQSQDTADSTNFLRMYADVASGSTINVNTGGVIRFCHSAEDFTSFSEAMRIDADGNLLVGVTSTTIPGIGNTTAGVSIRGDDGSFFSRSLGSGDTNNVVSINRSTADGPILGFQKDGTTVGSIGTNNGVPYLSGPLAGGIKLSYYDATNGIIFPVTTTGAIANGTHDLGYSAAKFRDLYLSGTSNVGVGRFTAQNSTNSAATLVLGHEGSSKSQIRAYGINAGTIGSLEFMVSAADGTGSNSMTLDSGGNLLVGTTSSAAKITVEHSSTSTPAAFFDNTNAGTSGVQVIGTSLPSTANNTNCYHLKSTTQSVASYYLYGDGSSSFTSDERQKKNIVTTRDGYIDDLKNLRVVDYHWNNQEDTEDKKIGLIAQEVEQVFPHLVVEHELEGAGVRKNLKGSDFTFILIKAIQEQQDLIEALTARIAALES